MWASTVHSPQLSGLGIQHMRFKAAGSGLRIQGLPWCATMKFLCSRAKLQASLRVEALALCTVPVVEKAFLDLWICALQAEVLTPFTAP